MICQHFPSDFDSPDEFSYFLSLHIWNEMRETVATVNHQTAKFRWIFFSIFVCTQSSS